MLYWSMHLTHEAASKAQSLIITDDLYAPTGAGTAEPCRGGECWRTTQFWLQESRLERFHAVAEKLNPWVLGHRSWEAFRAETTQARWELTISVSWRQLCWKLPEYQQRNMCRPLARCAFARRLRGTEERTEHFRVLFFGTVCHKKKMCLPHPLLGTLPVSDLKVIWLFHKCLLSLHSSQRKALLVEKWQQHLDRHNTISQTWQWHL